MGPKTICWIVSKDFGRIARIIIYLVILLQQLTLITYRLKKPDQTQSVSRRYDNLTFRDNELPIIFEALKKRTDKYPFQSEALLLMMFTGRRETETLKIKWSDVDRDNT